MTRKDTIYLAGMVLIAALLLANLLRPTQPYAYEVPQEKPPVPVAISAAGESAWALVGTKVYYVSLRNRADLPAGQRTINIIDSRSTE